MALPIGKAADLAKDMAKKGLVGSISMGKPKAAEPPDLPSEAEEDDPVMQDIDDLVPGLASLIRELVDKCLAEGSNSEDDDSSPL